MYANYFYIIIKAIPPFFSFSVECVSWCWVGRSVGLKKKNHKKSRNRRPWYPRMTLKVNIHIFGLTKCTIYCKKCSCFVPVFLYAVTMLIFQIKRIISSEKWFNYVVPFFFFLENAKNLGWSEDAKRRKKWGWPKKTIEKKKILKVRLNVFTSEDLITGKTIVKKKKFSKNAWMCLRVTTSVTFTTIAMHEAQVYTSGRGAQGARRGKK